MTLIYPGLLTCETLFKGQKGTTQSQPLDFKWINPTVLMKVWSHPNSYPYCSWFLLLLLTPLETGSSSSFSQISSNPVLYFCSSSSPLIHLVSLKPCYLNLNQIFIRIAFSYFPTRFQWITKASPYLFVGFFFFSYCEWVFSLKIQPFNFSIFVDLLWGFSYMLLKSNYISPTKDGNRRVYGAFRNYR